MGGVVGRGRVEISDESMKILDKNFKTKADAEKHIRQILQTWKGKPFIAGDDGAFVLALLDLHPRKHLVIDCGLKHVRVQEIENGFLRFLAVRTDDSIRDFSWRNCLSPRSQRSEVMGICRSVIEPQISFFRNEFWRKCKTANCPITNNPMTIADSDVDHAPPNTFAALVEAWLKVVRTDFELIEIQYKSGYQERSVFQETWLEEDWAEYHSHNADLRVVSRRANRSILRRKSHV